MEMTESNPNALKDIALKLKAMDRVQSKVGWFETSVYPDGAPVAYVALLNELGEHQRPFMRPTAIEQNDKWAKTGAVVSKEVIAGHLTPEQAMNVIAAQARGDIVKKIESITSPALSPITLGARKYRREGKKVTGATIGEIARRLKDGTLDVSGVPDKPLDDTGLMIATATFVTETR